MLLTIAQTRKMYAHYADLEVLYAQVSKQFRLHGCRKLEDVLTSTQAQLVDLIRQAKEESHAGEPAATAYTVTVAVARSDTEDGSAGLKRSDSVAWSSASLHASSDMWEQQLDATPEQQTQAGHIVNTQSSVVTAEGVIRAYELGDQR